MVLSCQNVSKSYGADEILKDVSFRMEDYEKAAVVGANGAGKTTLLRILAGDLDADEGKAVLSKDRTLGYLPQNPDITGNRAIFEEILSAREDLLSMQKELAAMEEKMSACSGEELDRLMENYDRVSHVFEQEGGPSCKSEAVGVLKGLGFGEGEFGKRMQDLSGGERTRVCLGKLLVTKPDIILLDEPTNHLDIGSISWLETFLSNYKGAVLAVSHDRYFLDRIAQKVIEIERGTAAVFSGGYSDYAVKKDKEREARLRRYYAQQREKKRQEEVIAKLKSFNREKSVKRANSREKKLEKMEFMDKPEEDRTDFRLELEPRILSGNDVLRVEGLSKSFPGQLLFSDLGFEIKRGERVALIGDNGAGKTTILKIINGMADADAGTVRLGTNVHVGYFDQEHQMLHPQKDLMAEIADDYPKLTQTEIRNVLASFAFTGDDVFKKISDLSGGEQGRAALAKLMLSEANFLILDEPTNHLDITSKEILEQALNRYLGTVLFVSHDRYFINRTATRILELSGNALTSYLGDYDYYVRKRKELQEAAGQEARDVGTATQESESKLAWKQKKEEQARQRKAENDRKRAEEAIEGKEARIREIEAEFSDGAIATDAARLQELQLEYNRAKEELDALYEKWSELVEDGA